MNSERITGAGGSSINLKRIAGPLYGIPASPDVTVPLRTVTPKCPMPQAIPKTVIPRVFSIHAIIDEPSRGVAISGVRDQARRPA